MTKQFCRFGNDVVDAPKHTRARSHNFKHLASGCNSILMTLWKYCNYKIEVTGTDTNTHTQRTFINWKLNNAYCFEKQETHIFPDACTLHKHNKAHSGCFCKSQQWQKKVLFSTRMDAKLCLCRNWLHRAWNSSNLSQNDILCGLTNKNIDERIHKLWWCICQWQKLCLHRFCI